MLVMCSAAWCADQLLLAALVEHGASAEVVSGAVHQQLIRPCSGQCAGCLGCGESEYVLLSSVLV